MRLLHRSEGAIDLDLELIAYLSQLLRRCGLRFRRCSSKTLGAGSLVLVLVVLLCLRSQLCSNLFFDFGTQCFQLGDGIGAGTIRACLAQSGASRSELSRANQRVHPNDLLIPAQRLPLAAAT